MRLLVVFGIVCVLVMGCMQKNVKQDTTISLQEIKQELVIKEIPAAVKLCELTDSTKQMIDIGECKLFCEIEGKGTPIVLINGGPGETHHVFHPWFSGLKDTFTVIYYDQRGCGVSDYTPVEGYTFDQAVDDLENLRKALKIDKWIVLGVSYGGAMAQYYTVKYPENVLGQILVGAAPMMANIPQVNADKELFTEKELTVFKDIEALFSSGKINAATMVYNKKLNGFWKRGTLYPLTPERLVLAANYDTKFDPNSSTDFRSYNFAHVFETCPIPTLIIEAKNETNWASDKPVLFKENHRNAELVILDNARHYSYRDQPEQFMSEIKRWGSVLKKTDEKKIAIWKKNVNTLIGDQLEQKINNRNFLKLILNKGVAEAVAYYHAFKKANPNKPVFFEESVNVAGYQFLNAAKVDEAVALLNLIVIEFPNSWNAFDSLAEAQVKQGNKEEAIKNYKHSIELNPENENGKKMLKDLNDSK